ncbi:MMPL family transporter [Kutzneria albida]|uniref:Membrane transport protein MMPL domain-containing protein n=1 Tax=Kutzneria albida DSM 43870 TaxID=1449976 RepID=W5WFA1_9PSEU|nr:MMPL family transporter [Kutzneria albida]AHH99256.1 hypothetical protein KALB_5895 [Kutzneria albida DSM 43870]
MQNKSVTVRAARWSARHPWTAIIGWVVFVALCLVAGSAIGSHAATNRDFGVGEAGRMEAMAEDNGLTLAAVEQILITAPSGSLDRAQAQAVAAEISQRMGALPAVASVDPPVVSADGSAISVPVTMKGDAREAASHVDTLLRQTAEVQKAHPGLRVEETGRGSTGKGLNEQRASDLALSEKITLPITLVILLLVFGSLLTAGVPVLLAITAIAGTMGLYSIASHVFPDAGVANQVILLLGMAVGVDYALFYVKRVREERERAGGQISSQAAVELAAATSGRVVVMSGLAVIASTACLFLADDVIFSSLAAGTIIVVLVAMISSLTVLPALLTKLGKRMDSQLPFLRRKRSAGGGRRWNALLRPAMTHPVATLVIATLAMLLLALPGLGMKLGTPGEDTYSREIPALQVADRLDAAFPAQKVTNTIGLHSTELDGQQIRAALQGLVRTTSTDPLFAGNTAPRIRIASDGHTGTLDLGTPFTASTRQASDALHVLRQRYVPQAFGALPGARYAVSGDVARDQDYTQHQNEQLPWVLLVVLLVTFLVTAFVFRSVVIAFFGTLLTMLSTAGALGGLVLLFQSSFSTALFGADSAGFIGSRVPLFLIVILFGLSMDYQIFVVSRIREAVLRGVPTRRAVAEGIASSASVVTGAAVVMVSVFASFTFLHLLEVKQTGYALVLGVLLDAVVVRILILPALLALLGRASWWPSRAARRAATAPAPAETTARLSQPIR